MTARRWSRGELASTGFQWGSGRKEVAGRGAVVATTDHRVYVHDGNGRETLKRPDQLQLVRQASQDHVFWRSGRSILEGDIRIVHANGSLTVAETGTDIEFKVGPRQLVPVPAPAPSVTAHYTSPGIIRGMREG